MVGPHRNHVIVIRVMEYVWRKHLLPQEGLPIDSNLWLLIVGMFGYEGWKIAKLNQKVVLRKDRFSLLILTSQIEKQLNKIELSHKFAKAVFFGANQGFGQESRESQEIVTACRRLVQNAIILWNYFYLSE
ncbi:MAG: Tn3 family transposase [Opitutaceae bacterium]|nr:Tn3 family transposase [Cytophagales bacterium]